MKHSVDIGKLASLYRDGLTVRQIGELENVPARTVARYLNKAGVELRNQGAPRHAELADAEWLRQQYVADGLSTTQIAELIGATASRVSHWLRRHGIETRAVGSETGHDRNTQAARDKMSEAKRGKNFGDQNPNWRGGMPSRDADRNRYPAKLWVKAVKDRDGWTCQECGSTDRLHAHHIKRWKDHPSLRYDVGNGITLCHACHERAHGRGFKFRWPQ